MCKLVFKNVQDIRLSLCVLEQNSTTYRFSSVSIVAGWPPRARPHPVPTRSSLSGPGLSGRSAPRRCGRCPPVNQVGTAAPDLQEHTHLEGCFLWKTRVLCAGFGVDQLRDDNLETYWQSDGSQPHLVNIQFRYFWKILLNHIGSLLTSDSC